MTVVVLDLEGTVYTREGLIPGAREAVAELRRRADAVRFVTNTDSRSDEDMLGHLVALGVDAAPAELFTPVSAATELLATHPGARAFVLGTDAVRAQLARRLTVTDDPDDATHVVVGDCRDRLSYPLLNAAFGALSRGCPLLALQKGRFFLSGGRRQLDTGGVVAALEYAAGVEARLLGKPAPAFLELALAGLSGAADDVWVVGEDLTSDIAVGRAIGATTVLVRTGTYDADGDATHTVDSIVDVPALLD